MDEGTRVGHRTNKNPSSEINRASTRRKQASVEKKKDVVWKNEAVVWIKQDSM
jgi:hypothetical protein